MTNESQLQGSSSLPIMPSAFHGHWRLYFIEGTVLLVLGLGAIALPIIASLAVAVILGWLFLIGGGVGLITTIMARDGPGFWWSLISAIITIVAGGALIGWWSSAVISIALVLTAFLAADGVLSMLFAVEHWRRCSGGSGWLFANGILDLFLAVWVTLAFPFSGVWIVGVIVGIDLLFGGLALIAMAQATRRPSLTL